MTRYQLNYFDTPKTRAIRKANRRWAATLVASVIFLTFSLVFFGGLGTAFRFRTHHLTLREQHDALRLRYDSLYAAKLEADKQLAKIQLQLKLSHRTP